MTPSEIRQMWDGYQWQLDQLRTIAAVATNAVLGAWVQDAPDPERIAAAMGAKPSG